VTTDIYFIPHQAAGRKDGLLERTKALLEKAGLRQVVERDRLIAVKLHFGEPGNTAFLRPVYVRQAVDEIKALGGKPFLVDTNTLYRRQRANAYDHLVAAHQHGFGFDAMGAPILIADGLKSHAYHKVKIDGVHFKEAAIADGIYCADAMVVLTHFTGHIIAGIGGAIKNLAMGCAAPQGKRQMHSASRPKVTVGKCVACGKCIEWCPVNAIALAEKGGRRAAALDESKCLTCGQCAVTCPTGAIGITWDSSSTQLQEKMAEYALGAVKNKGGKVLYVTYLLDVTPGCDCMRLSETPVVPDVGVIAGRDPVAMDQAGTDLVNQQEATPGCKLQTNRAKGEDKFRGVYPNIDWSHQLAHGERIGLGRRAYRLVPV
jgi:uncharacterized Fe-S center protein